MRKKERRVKERSREIDSGMRRRKEGERQREMKRTTDRERGREGEPGRPTRNSEEPNLSHITPQRLNKGPLGKR